MSGGSYVKMKLQHGDNWHGGKRNPPEPDIGEHEDAPFEPVMCMDCRQRPARDGGALCVECENKRWRDGK